MNENQRNFGRVAVYAGVIGAMAVSLIPATARTAAAQGTTRKIGNFDVAGRFLEVWSKAGNDQSNTYVNGLPITARRAEISTEDGKPYDTQWFERAKYEAHPENKAPYDVLLGRLGANYVEGRGSVDPATGKVRNASDAAFVGISQPADADGKTKVWFQETKHSISGKILTYWNQYGGLQQFGFPLSEAFDEISTDGKTYNVQYFERARFEVHPEKQDPYAVELGLLGVQQYKATPIAAADLPIAAPAGVTSSKDTLIVAEGQEPDTLCGICDNALTMFRHLDAITFEDGVVTADQDENYFPLLAWYVPTIENGGSFYVGAGNDRHLVTKYKLRHGVKWPNGSEITSNDMVFSYQLIMNPDTPVVSRQTQSAISSIENPDKYTMVYNWMSVAQATAKYNDPKTDKNQFGFLKYFVDHNQPVIQPNYFLIGTVHPKYALANVPADKLNESDYARAPVGYGPFKVDHWTSGQEMLLVKNPNYNLTTGPLLSKVLMRYITDINQASAQLLTGDVDMVASEPIVVPPANSDQLKAAGFVVESRPASSFEHADFRWGDYAPFTDKNVRQAIIQGINRQRIVDVAFKGAGGVTNTVVPPSVFHSLENPDFAKNWPDLAAKYKLPDYKYDPEAAKALLDKAGWTVGGDGIRTKNGERLSFEYASTVNAVRQQVQTLVQADLKAIGVEALTKAYTTGQFFGSGPDNPILTGQTKLSEFAWIQASINDFSVWDSRQRATTESSALPNKQQYANPAVDAANDAFDASGLRTHEMAEASAQAQVALMNDLAIIPLAQRANIELYSGKLMNHKLTNTLVTQFWNIEQLYFK